MSRPGTILTNQILARFGALRDARLFRNVSAHAYLGKYEGKTREGHIILSNARPVETGLCVGASDLIGIAPGGLFLAGEVKAGKDRVTSEQRTFLSVVDSLGGIAGIVRGPEDMEELIERARARL